jgi:hypothetical protein
MAIEKVFTGVTLHGMPVRVELEWPFHPSEGGSDWYTLHGTLRLNDGGELHSDIAVNLAQTVREILPALDGDVAYWVAINTARKALDDKQLQLLKSGKRQPVNASSRCYSIRYQHFRFNEATPAQVEEFVARKVFWCSGSEKSSVLIADPCDAQYLGAADPDMIAKLIAAAKKLADGGLLELSGDNARATDAILAQAHEFQATKDHAVEELHLKHAYERA